MRGKLEMTAYISVTMSKLHLISFMTEYRDNKIDYVVLTSEIVTEFFTPVISPRPVTSETYQDGQNIFIYIRHLWLFSS